MGQHSAPRHRPARTAADARFRLKSSIKPEISRTQITITAIFIVIGFTTTAAIIDNQADSVLSSTRQSDLVGVLDNLAQREARLRQELIKLESDREALLGGDEYAALNSAKDRAKALALIAGTESTSGAGINIKISGSLTAVTLLDAIQELRDAGAKAIEVADANLNVRVVANTWFADGTNGVTVSGTNLVAPLTISVIGDKTVLMPALQIPGGLVDTISTSGGQVSITDSTNIIIKSVVPLATS